MATMVDTVSDLIGEAAFADDEEELEWVRSEIASTSSIIQKYEEELQQIVQQLDAWNQEDEELRKQSSNSKVKDAKSTFNDKPKKGIDMLIECGEIEEKTPEAVAQYLNTASGLNKASVGDYLGENDEFNLKVLEAFAHLYDFNGQDFDEALRAYLSGFRLPGESQKIDRMMEAFAKRYHDCNPQQFANSDTAYVLAFATIMLNTSLHNPNIKDKMSLDMFIGMNRGIDNGGSLDADLLTRIYESIRDKEFDLHDTNDGFVETFVDAEKSGWMLKEGAPVHMHMMVAVGHHSSYKMQTTSEEEMNDWIVKLTAAMTKNPLMTLYRDKLRKAKGS
ncbi:hypothetical protein PTSG_10329 [Salpingoeca rosetta]|uniref:SEC7 domain-containing protein n=1 Tax=Salpingoeca rosetta (strain ATCC 50818 / BSB-021) TaxID=946362 RepID=F2UQZ8_SALR5|nr:uncharacterized protein PTSG_10329 [Salpingoeca rosetta]EGD80053.1 hypothetical protein PTSG_10329 [Salpingoeca rosetta]|eukprot:XP_004988378.1 hypothetical protein PTSG_10329 [Salpingoeca rosetta]